MPRTPPIACLVLLAAPAAGAQATCAQLEAKLQGFAPQMGDHLGTSVALGADVALAGAPEDSVPPIADSGSVSVFARSGSGWVFEALLSASDPLTDAEFGNSVAVDGARAVVGAKRALAPFGTTPGAAYVFDRVGTTWPQPRKIVAPDSGNNDCFGASVDVEGDRIVVGAILDEPAALSLHSTGSMYFFELSGGMWSATFKRNPPAPVDDGHFGQDLDLDGDTVLVGEPGGTGITVKSGAAWVFTRAGVAWNLESKLEAGDGEFDEGFGASVALDGDLAVVGAPRDGDQGQRAGAAYVFRRAGTVWTEEQKLTAADGMPFDVFGESVSTAGGVIAVGVRQHDAGGEDAGAVYLFRHDGTAWIQVEKIVAGDAVPEARFGGATAMHGTNLLVGAPRDDAPLPQSGSAYVYRLLDSEVATYCTGKTSSLGCIPFVSASGVASATATAPFSVQAADLIPNEAGYLFYGFQKGNLSFHGGKLCVKSPFERWLPVKAAGATGAPPCSGVLVRNFNARIQSAVDPLLTPGNVVFAQFTQRDPGAPGGFPDTLTDGIRFQVCP